MTGKTILHAAAAGMLLTACGSLPGRGTGDTVCPLSADGGGGVLSVQPVETEPMLFRLPSPAQIDRTGPIFRAGNRIRHT